MFTPEAEARAYMEAEEFEAKKRAFARLPKYKKIRVIQDQIAELESEIAKKRNQLENLLIRRR
jgi:hypothetical protein